LPALEKPRAHTRVREDDFRQDHRCGTWQTRGIFSYWAWMNEWKHVFSVATIRVCSYGFLFRANISKSACAECLIPMSTDTPQQRRIDDQFPKRIDQCHVERREAVYAADINP